MGGYTYKIINRMDGKFYVGSTVDIDKRWRRHMNTLKNSSHHNINLQKAYNCNGRGAFELEIIYEGVLYLQKEQDLLDNTPKENLYNIGKGSVGGDNHTNNPNLEDIKKRTSETLKNLRNLEDNPWKDVDFRGELNPNWKGGISTEEALIWDTCGCGERKKVVSTLCFNCHVNQRHAERNPFFGKSHSEATKEKIRKAHTDKPNKSCWVGVVISGEVFKNMKEAATHYEVSRGTVTYRCKSKNYPDWNYL